MICVASKETFSWQKSFFYCKKKVLRCEKRFFTVRTNIQSGEKLIFPPGKGFCSREKKNLRCKEKVFRGMKLFFTARIKILSGEKLIFPPGKLFVPVKKKNRAARKKICTSEIYYLTVKIYNLGEEKVLCNSKKNIFHYSKFFVSDCEKLQFFGATQFIFRSSVKK